MPSPIQILRCSVLVMTVLVMAPPSAFGQPVTDTLRDRVLTTYHSGQLDLALTLARQDLAETIAALGDDHLDVAAPLNNLAMIQQALGEHANAKHAYLRALDIKQRHLGAHHPAIALSLNNLASLYQATGELDDALPLYQRALAIDEAAFGSDHPTVATDLNNLATCFHSLGQFDRAQALYHLALDILIDHHGHNHPAVAQTQRHLAILHVQLGHHDQARALFKRALDARVAALPPDDPRIRQSVDDLAAFQLRIVDGPDARPPMAIDQPGGCHCQHRSPARSPAWGIGLIVAGFAMRRWRHHARSP